MKTHILTVISSFFAVFGMAQDGKLRLEQDERINDLLAIYQKVNSKRGFYQIQVGFKSNDAAAQRLKNKVELDFPGWFTEIKFREPTYRIRVGKFYDRLEAERRFLEVRKKYPNAMLLKPES